MTQLAAVIDALDTILAARPALSGVEVTSVPLGSDSTIPDMIEIGSGDAERDWHAMRGNQPVPMEEDGAVRGRIRVQRTGAGETVGRQARDRAVVLLDEVDAAVAADHTLGGVCLWARVTQIALSQELTPEARVAEIDFTVVFKALL